MIKPYYEEPNITIYHGDCLEIMPELEPESIDSIVTDPPYGLKFMGKEWDHGIPGVPFWKEALRIAKPGCHLLAFGGTRTHHRLMCAIEDAGWEIRDTIMWVYGSGFPKSLNISKKIDQMKGAKRKVVGYGKRNERDKVSYGGNSQSTFANNTMKALEITTSTTPEAQQWEGWGTALKPAWEPIIIARKPIIGTVAKNILKYGTGGLNIDGCRIGTKTELHSQSKESARHKGIYGEYSGLQTQKINKGRFPANLIHDGSEEVIVLFPNTKSGFMSAGIPRLISDNPNKNTYEHFNPDKVANDTYGNSGSASRFFYCAKASRSERDEGLEGMIQKEVPYSEYREDMRNTDSFVSKYPDGSSRPMNKVRNNHPTVKPLALMRYLCRLVTPPSGVVIDMFMGSGSTGKAALKEGFRFIGIDDDESSCEIAKYRMISPQGLLPFKERA